MAQFINLGNGSGGDQTLSGTYSPIDSSSSGTGASTSVSATNASFAAGQIILIHQSRGAGVGAWEMNQIASYVAGTITTVLPLVSTYTDGAGADQAQTLVLPQYSNVTVSATLSAKPWDGDVGGIIAFLCRGRTTINGTITAVGAGYRGTVGQRRGTGKLPDTAESHPGMGASGCTTTGCTMSGNGGGSSSSGTFAIGTGGGNGSSHQGAGTLGGGGAGSVGTPYGTDTLTTIFFGSGAVGGYDDGGSVVGGTGATGGGAIMIFTNQLRGTGTITAAGGVGTVSASNVAGGSASGGSIFLKGIDLDYSTMTITAAGGAAPGGAFAGVGGPGGTGYVRIEACRRSGSSTPSASESLGGFSFCASSAQIF